MSEDISKIISKYKMYMSFDGNEYEMIQKVELNQTFEEIERLKEELEYTIPIVEHNKTITRHLKEIERLNEQRQKVIDYIKHNILYYYDEDLDEHITQYEVDGVEILKIVGEIE